jgi:DNA polymerase III sliding clamp (beta) subunit (PCNA family)
MLIPRNVLKAMLDVAPNKELRDYLNSVLVKVVTSSKIHLIATDGSILLAATLEENSCVEVGTDIIIPYQTVKLALSALAKNEVAIELKQINAEEKSYQLGMVAFKSMDAKYPAYERVIPSSVTGEHGDFDPELVAKISKAVALATGFRPKLIPNGQTGAGVVQGAASKDEKTLFDKVVGVVMPLRWASGASYQGWAS